LEKDGFFYISSGEFATEKRMFPEASPSSIDYFAIMDHNGVSLTVRRREEIVPW
jgi:hypothetical protein